MPYFSPINMTMTPEQFKKIALKEDFDKLEKKFERMDGKVDKIIATLDGMAKNMKTYREEQISNIVAHDRYEGRIVVLEKKMDKVEAKLAGRK